MIVNKIRERGDPNSIGKIPRLEQARWDLIVMESAGTDEYATHLNSKGAEANRVAEHVRLLGMASIQADLARIIAADLLLGNFDRLAVNNKGAKFHGGNFLVDLSAGARFVPIDNDVVAPSFEHVITKNDAPATQEQLYAVVIHGGMLKDDNHAFPANEQSSMSGLLGANSPDQIYKILNETMPAVPFKGVDPYAQERQQLRQDAGRIAPMVQGYMRDLLAELKTPGGQRVGLNALMKAQQNIEGMNYDTFKLKSRFAALMLDAANLDPQEVERRAQAYQKYRTWKQNIRRLFERVLPYPLPGKYDRASWGNVAVRGVEKRFDKDMKQKTGDIDATHALKKNVRKGRIDEAQLRQEWNTLKAKPDNDQAVVKSKLVCIAKLYTYDLQDRSQLLREVTSIQLGQNWVDNFYLKAIRKRQADLPTIMEDFRTALNTLRTRMEEGSLKKEWDELRKTFKTFETAVGSRPIY